METPIVLARADFFELQALILKIQQAERDAQAAVDRLQRIQAQAQAKLTALGLEYRFDAQGLYRLDETACALVQVS
jgi:hypothetical protein